MGATPELLDEPRGHRREDGLDRGGDRSEGRVVHERLDRLPLGEGSQDAGEECGSQDGQERWKPQRREDDQQQQREQVDETDVEGGGQRRSRCVGAERRVRVRIQSQDQEDDKTDSERRTCGPEHVADVLTDGQPAADELGDEDRGLRQRGHLVPEVGATDDGSRCDRLVEAHHLRHSDERHTQGADGGPGAAGDHSDQGADDRCGQVEHGRADQPDAVVDDRGDGPGHVPGADECADGQEDEDRPHSGGDAAHGRVRDTRNRVAVLERHQAGERGAQQQRHLKGSVGGVDPEQVDGDREQGDQNDDRQHGIEHAGSPRAAGSSALARHGRLRLSRPVG